MWLAECMPRETKAGVSKLQPGVLPAAAKCTEDGAPAIREAAYAFLAAAALKVHTAPSALGAAPCRVRTAWHLDLRERGAALAFRPHALALLTSASLF
jgi:hypothetical protein